MKKLVLFVLVVFCVSCGTSDVPPPPGTDCQTDGECSVGYTCKNKVCVDESGCTDGQKEVDGKCVNLPNDGYCMEDENCSEGQICVEYACVEEDLPGECIGNQDCPARNLCLMGMCVEEPECVVDDDCEEDNYICSLGHCVYYATIDSCYGKSCGDGGECDQCGDITVCEEDNTCKDVCNYAIELRRSNKIESCQDYSNCSLCLCIFQGYDNYIPYDKECAYDWQKDYCIWNNMEHLDTYKERKITFDEYVQEMMDADTNSIAQFCESN